MGLLDDAIREHLELKRRRGADPGEVAREQREALDPVPRDDTAVADEEAAISGGPAPAEAVEVEPTVAETASEDLHNATESVHDANPSSAGETAELDMRSVLGEEQGAAEEALVEEESLEWEVPAEASNPAAARDPVDGVTIEEHLHEDEPAEDVLEETPDFLRDTPEQERLWFEQRPPRDFDFDK